jgi:putative ATP-binding cassette transporter
MLDTDEQKAVAFAHALLAKPRWLILDETLEGLEPDIQERFAGLLTEMKDTTTIYIGRSEAYVQALSPRVIHLQALATSADAVSPTVAPTVATTPAATGLPKAKALSVVYPSGAERSRRQ